MPLQTSPSFAAKWLKAHAQAAKQLGKPLLLEEFGKLLPRDAFYTAVLQVIPRTPPPPRPRPRPRPAC